MTERILCRVLTGPTGSGKSEWAMKLAKEQHWDILCMDSMQIYRGMDIGTAKPTRREQEQVPHYLLDLADPAESFSVARYREIAEETILESRRRGREVLFVGGTGLYLQAMMHPMIMGEVEADSRRREELLEQAETPEGRRALQERLRELDPVTADKLPVQDVRRIIRAIEVSEKTGHPFSAQPERETPSPFDWRAVSLRMDRNTLYDRINRRVIRMMEQGLVREVEELLQAGVPETAQSMNGIGYRQIIPLLKGEIQEDEAVREIQLASRHYAKRQMTFLRREETIRYVEALKPNTEEELRKALGIET